MTVTCTFYTNHCSSFVRLPGTCVCVLQVGQYGARTKPVCDSDPGPAYPQLLQPAGPVPAPQRSRGPAANRHPASPRAGIHMETSYR